MIGVVIFIDDFSILERQGGPFAVDQLDADGAVGIGPEIDGNDHGTDTGGCAREAGDDFGVLVRQVILESEPGIEMQGEAGFEGLQVSKLHARPEPDVGLVVGLEDRTGRAAAGFGGVVVRVGRR